jgi:hypothetical protein
MSTVYTTKASLENAIYAWLDPLLTQQIIWGDSKAPAPTSAYFVLDLTTPVVEEGNGFERIVNGSSRTLVQRRQATLTVTALGESAVDSLWALKSRVNLESSQEALSLANLSLLRVENILDASELLNTQIRERATMDLILGYTRSDADGTSWIQFVELEDPLGDVSVIG